MIDNSKAIWKKLWNQHIGAYVGAIPRQAYYLYFILKLGDRRILEIAAGSFRDTVRLNEWGYDCVGVDFLEEAVKEAKGRYPTYQHKMLCENACQLSFSDKSFDVSFHNGFYVLFQDNEFLHKLIREQIRVTRRCVVCSVHNKLNSKLLELFKNRAQSDTLYDVRFYDPDEIMSLLQPHCCRVEVLPFGEPFFDRFIRYVEKFPGGLKWLYRVASRAMDLKRCERLMAVGYLE